MNKFAKLFEFDDIGQVLVKLDSGEDGPEVRFYFHPEGFGVCSMAVNFKGDEDGRWDAAEAAFDLVDAQKAESMVSETIKSIPRGIGS